MVLLACLVVMVDLSQTGERTTGSAEPGMWT
jgi:hypothetical protein